MRRRSSERKALSDQALKEGLAECDLNDGRRICSILHEIRAQGEKYTVGKRC